MTFKHFRLLLPLWLTIAATALASTTWYVNGVTGSDTNNCLSATAACKTIGHAISLAASGDTIKVTPATYPENLDIGLSLKITGSQGHTVIDGGGVNTAVTISNTTANVTLSSLRIQNGSSSSGVGGVSNIGTLTLKNSTVTGNRGIGISNSGTLSISGSIISYNSRGIGNSGTLTMSSSTVTRNSVNGFGTTGIINSGALIVNRSTISRNIEVIRCFQKNCYGAGSAIDSGGTLILNNSTVSGNSLSMLCKVAGGCIFHETGYAVGGSGGASSINNSTISANGLGYVGIAGAVTLQNSIVSNNARGNCAASITSNGYNLSSDATCAFSGPGDMNNTDPMLGPLHNNGGPTQTMALPSGSPAIDAGNPAGCTDGLGHLLITDQRGQPRPDKEDTGGCDIGAYEGQSD